MAQSSFGATVNIAIDDQPNANPSTIMNDFAFPARFYDRVKPVFDFSLALVLFLLALPCIIIAALLVRATSKGHFLYSQARVGRGGRVFFIYKIRSMYHNCESKTGIQWSIKGDMRVTFIGRILRKTHLDELPQLWNVLRGDMSLVGPRPERPEFTTVLEKSIEGYHGRLAVKPGLTGLAQIQLPPDTSLVSVRNKLALDLVYVHKRSLWLDLRLILGTVIYLFGVSYAFVRIMMRLPQFSDVPALIVSETAPIAPAVVVPQWQGGSFRPLPTAVPALD